MKCFLFQYLEVFVLLRFNVDDYDPLINAQILLALLNFHICYLIIFNSINFFNWPF